MQGQCENHLVATHPDDFLVQICNRYVELIHNLLFREVEQDCFGLIIDTLFKSVKIDFKTMNFKKIDDKSIVGGKFSSACYITDSWPSVLFLAGKYKDDTKAAILANTNLGGDNVHRGAVLATILGLCNDNESQQLDQWFTSLEDYRVIESEINDLLAVIG